MKKGRLVLTAILILMVAAAAYLYSSDTRGGGRRGYGGRQVTVVAEPAKLQNFADVVEAIGTVAAKESVLLQPRVSDTVKKIHFRDGQIVLKGDLLVELEDAEEQAQLTEARANMVEAEQQFQRIKDLASRGSATAADLDAQQRVLSETRSRLAVAEARIRDRRISAPFDGVLGFRQISQGSLIGPTTAITTIDAVQTMNLDFSVPERFLATLKTDLEVQARVEAFPDQLFTGIVKTLDTRVDPATRLVTVRAEINNEDLLLRPGMLMVVQLISYRWEGVSVPEEAIVPTDGRTYAYTVKDGVAQRTPVTLGLRRPGYVEVKEGIATGDLVVTEGTFRLGRGATPVKLREVDPVAPVLEQGVGEGEAS